MVPVRLPTEPSGRFVGVVFCEVSSQQPVARTLSHFCVMFATMSERDDTGTRHGSADRIFIRRGVKENALFFIKAPLNKGNRSFDVLCGHVESGVPCRAKKHQLPAGGR